MELPKRRVQKLFLIFFLANLAAIIVTLALVVKAGVVEGLIFFVLAIIALPAAFHYWKLKED